MRFMRAVCAVLRAKSIQDVRLFRGANSETFKSRRIDTLFPYAMLASSHDALRILFPNTDLGHERQRRNSRPIGRRHFHLPAWRHSAFLQRAQLELDHRRKSPRIVCQFGLPAQAPDRRWLENDQLPIFQTAWETNGIRYTQKVLLTTLGTNDPSLASPTHPESVVLVQITGLNTNAEYTSASASFAIEVGGRPLDLELREGLIYVSGSPEAAPMGALDIPGEGITAARGPQLKFQGNMPPGTSGSMTVKIPVTALKDPKAITRLQDLDFDEQFQRVKKAWKQSLQANSLPWPFTWVEPQK